MKNSKIYEEVKEIYFAIKQIMEESKCDYCQSWWLNIKNFNLKSKLSTRKINQRASVLVKKGILVIDKENTSTSQGVCYKLTNKPFSSYERKEKLKKLCSK